MCNLVVLLLVITPTLVSSQGQSGGGTKAPNASVPYMVSLRERILKSDSFYHICGGSIISPRAILTAAHCVNGTKPEILEAVVGTNQVSAGGQSYSVKTVVTHEKYDLREFEENYEENYTVNDIAIIITNKEIQFNDNVRPVELSDEPVEAGEELLVTGWGATSDKLVCSETIDEATSSTLNTLDCEKRKTYPDDLMQLNVKAVSYEDCKSALKGFIRVFETQTCAMAGSGTGVCNGDSGGPLVKVEGGKQVGIVSEGLPPCGLGKPDVYTSVHSYLPWIKKTLLNPYYYDDKDNDKHDIHNDSGKDNDKAINKGNDDKVNETQQTTKLISE